MQPTGQAFYRACGASPNHPAFEHSGLYAYTKAFLAEYSRMPPPGGNRSKTSNNSASSKPTTNSASALTRPPS